MTEDSSKYLRANVLEACREGDLNALAATLASGLSLVGINDRWSPLLEAVYARQTQACAFILEAGGRVDFTDSTGSTALHQAARINSEHDQHDGGQRAAEIVTLLASHGASFCATNKSGRTPLQVAVIDNSLCAIDALLKAGSPPDYTPSSDRPPLHLAACLGFGDACHILISAGASLSKRTGGRTPEEWATFSHHTSLGLELKAIRQANEARGLIAQIANTRKPLA